MLSIIILSAAAVFLYFKGWLKITAPPGGFSGITKPLIGLSVLGFSITLKKP